MFTNEKPQLVHKYFLCAVELVEILPDDSLDSLFRFNFAKDTSREATYLNSEVFRNFLLQLSKAVKRNEQCDDDSIIYGSKSKHKRGNSTHSSKDESVVGYEFFFSNVMVKIFQSHFFFGQD